MDCRYTACVARPPPQVMSGACAQCIHACLTSNSSSACIYQGSLILIATCYIADIRMGTGAVSSRPDQHNDRHLQWSICHGGFLEPTNH